MKPTHFATPAAFRAWLHKHHEDTTELWVSFYKKGSGKLSMTWPEAVDQALCFGWIDGVRKSLDGERYVNRLTPRSPRSNWSARNIKRAKELIAEGLMRPAGLNAFEQRTDDRSAVYSYEHRKEARLDPAQRRRFRSTQTAWAFFQSRPPSYRQAAIWWVVSAKREPTRERRLTQLIEDSAAGRTVPSLTRRPAVTRWREGQVTDPVVVVRRGTANDVTVDDAFTLTRVLGPDNGLSDLVVMTFRAEPSFRTGPHYHTSDSVALVTDGRAGFRWGEDLAEEVLLEPGDWLYVGAGVRHEEITPEDSFADMVVVRNRGGGESIYEDPGDS